jgi:hypothetical protein
MSGRVSKSPSAKTLQRNSLARRIEETGYEIMPCTNCFRNRRVCRMSDASSRCSECAKRGRVCDGTFVASALTRTAAAQKKVESDIEKAELELETTLARLARLRRQRKILSDKTSELFSRGMRELDEEDGIRSQEQAILDEQHAVGEAQSFGAMGLLDWSSILPEVLDPEGFPSSRDSPSGTAVAGPSNL